VDRSKLAPLLVPSELQNIINYYESKKSLLKVHVMPDAKLFHALRLK
jgi:hypothetical protein